MSTSTVQPNFQNQRNLLIVQSNGLMLKCDKCNSAIKDYICFCDKCKKCLDLTCAGVKTRTENIIGNRKKHTVLQPAPDQEIPNSCPDCLKPRRSNVRSNNAIMPRWIPISSEVWVRGRPNQFAHVLLRNLDADYLLRKNMSGHKLEENHYGTIYSCSGCKGQGIGPHDACQSCSFHLHKDCSSPRKTMMHPFFPGMSFGFHSFPKIEYSCFRPRTVNCNACGMGVNGYLYKSFSGKKNLHPCCANLPRQIICGESGATMVLQQNTTSSCYYCHEKTVKVGNKNTDEIWSYVSRGTDNIHLHVPCIMKMLSDLKVVHLRSKDLIERTIMLISHVIKTEENYSMTKLDFQITAATDTEMKWETKFAEFTKYAKIALGAILASFLGDRTTFICNCIVALNS